MIVEKDIICPSCKNQIEVAYCSSCKENIFLKPVKTTIININDGKPYNIDIGRRNKRFHYGNPFSHRDYDGVIKLGNRTEAIQAFKNWLLGIKYQYVEQNRRQWILENMEKDLKYKVLGCWCKPKSCHGDVYIELLSKGCIEKYL